MEYENTSLWQLLQQPSLVLILVLMEYENTLFMGGCSGLFWS